MSLSPSLLLMRVALLLCPLLLTTTATVAAPSSVPHPAFYVAGQKWRQQHQQQQRRRRRVSVAPQEEAAIMPRSSSAGDRRLGRHWRTAAPVLAMGSYDETDEGGEGEDDVAPATPPPPPASKVENILKDLHSKGFQFRVVVIGNGAILETTSALGPHFATSKSPKTGEPLVTLASEDKSFEFHVKVDQVAKVTFSETDRPNPDGEGKKTLRVCRFIDFDGRPICSLILADSSPDAVEWWTNMTIRYGYEVQL